MRSSRQPKKQNSAKPPALPAAAVCMVIAVLIMLLGGREAEPIAFFSARKAAPDRPEEQRMISVLHEGAVLEMGLEDYLLGVTAAEMPVRYDIEALKAQAVAARTYTLRKLQHSGCSRNADADICTDSGHCQAYASEEVLKERWEEDYEQNRAKIKKAVYGTAGEIVTYRGDAIDALYHASAGGATENSEDVYKNEIAYLRGVESPDTDGYERTIKYSCEEFAERIKNKLNVPIGAQDLAEEMELLSRLESGRVEKIRIGESTFSGGKFRGAAGLPSAMFTYEIADGSIIFSVKGYGHGVGMSQSGANHYAQQGLDYREILHHYYTDVEIGQMNG